MTLPRNESQKARREVIAVAAAAAAGLGIAVWVFAYQKDLEKNVYRAPIVNLGEKTPTPAAARPPKAAPVGTLGSSTSLAAGWKTYRNEKYGLKYPADWKVEPLSGDPSGISLYPPGKQSNSSFEYAGDIIVISIPNPSGVDLRMFYKTQAPIDLYVNSTAFTPLVINGAEAVKFSGVYGMIQTDTVAINKGLTIIEVSDVGQLHRSDGTFDTITKGVF